MEKSKIILASLLAFAVWACKHETKLPADEDLTDCLKAKIIQFDQSGGKAVHRFQKSDGQTAYWFRTDARHLDGIEYVLNAQCDTICFICSECSDPFYCDEGIPIDSMELIWEP